MSLSSNEGERPLVPSASRRRRAERSGSEALQSWPVTATPAAPAATQARARAASMPPCARTGSPRRAASASTASPSGSRDAAAFENGAKIGARWA